MYFGKEKDSVEFVMFKNHFLKTPKICTKSSNLKSINKQIGFLKMNWIDYSANYVDWWLC